MICIFGTASVSEFEHSHVRAESHVHGITARSICWPFSASFSTLLADETLDKAAGELTSPQERRRGDETKGLSQPVSKMVRGKLEILVPQRPAVWQKGIIVVDALQGREHAFDHQAVAQAFGKDIKAAQLPLNRWSMIPGQTYLVRVWKKRFGWSVEAGTITESRATQSNAFKNRLRYRWRISDGSESSVLQPLVMPWKSSG